MHTNFVWLAGFTLVVISGYLLWSSRLTSIAHSRTSNDEGEDLTATPSDIDRHRYKAMPSLVPATPEQEEVIVQHVKEPLAEVVQEIPVTEISVGPLADDPDVDMHLKLAVQLQVIGDYEGTEFYAKLAASSTVASVKQRERAQILLRREVSAL